MNMRVAKRFLIGALIGIVIVIGAIFAQPLVTSHQNSISYQNHAGSFLLNVSNRGTFFCPSSYATATTMQGYGFLKAREGQLVIQPNSTAFLKINYNDPDQEVTVSSLYNNNSDFWLGPEPPNQWLFKVVGNDVNVTTKYNNTEIGLAIYDLNVTISPSHTNMSIIYELVTTSNAPNGTYTSPFWGICDPYLLVTVGNSYYNGTYGTGTFM